MSKYIVTPLVGFNEVKFGMPRKEVRNILGCPIREFKKSDYSKTTTDDFGEFHIFYNAEDKFEAVEFFEEADIQDDKNNVFPKSFNTADELPYAFTCEDNDYINEEYSIGIFAPNKHIESILFGVKGYY